METTKLKEWEELVGVFQGLETADGVMALKVSYIPPLVYPAESVEARTLKRALKNTEKGQIIGVLKTNNKFKPLIVVQR